MLQPCECGHIQHTAVNRGCSRCACPGHVPRTGPFWLDSNEALLYAYDTMLKHLFEAMRPHYEKP
jgi:hypothetical protein